MTNGDDLPLGAAAGSYSFQVDGGWEFLELSDFVRQYVHVYSLIHALGMIDDAARKERIQRAFRAHPWRGGWDSVNFFKSLVGTVPGEHRPRVTSIQIASPGSIDLRLAVWAARQTGRVVNAVCSDSVDKANATYSQMYERAKDMRLLRKDVKLLEAIESQEFHLGAALLRRGVFALFMGLFARGCVSPVLSSGGQQPSQHVPASFRRPAEPRNGTEYRRSVPLGRAPLLDIRAAFWYGSMGRGTDL